MRDKLMLESEPFTYQTGSAYEASPLASWSAVPGAEYIKWLQRGLNQLMGLRLAVDGILGPQTRSARRSFQQRSGLVADGIPGPLTEAALRASGLPAPPGVFSSSVPDVTGAISACSSIGAKEVLEGFDQSSAALKLQHQQKIAAIALCIKASQTSANPIRSLDVIGHASTEGDVQFNLDLGRAGRTHVERLNPPGGAFRLTAVSNFVAADHCSAASSAATCAARRYRQNYRQELYRACGLADWQPDMQHEHYSNSATGSSTGSTCSPGARGSD